MLLGIDLGTSSVKVLLLSPDGVEEGQASREYPVLAPRLGWSETDPEAWWSAVAGAVRQAVGARGAEVTAIGLSGQMHGVVLADAHGAALRPAVLWADARATRELATYHALPEAQRQLLANPITVGMAGPSLLWLRAHEAEAYGRARWALQPKDWLRLRLTGEAASDPSDASATLLYDVSHDRWAHDAIEVLGLRHELLAPVLPSAQVAGGLRAAAASALSLPAGLPVATGASDVAAAALGGGLLRDGDAQLTVGSGAQLVRISDEPRAAPTFGLHLYRAALPHAWYTMAAMQNAGLALEWVLSVLGLSWDDAYALALGAPPGCDELTFLPYLVGERTPHLDPHAAGAWIGLRRHHTKAHLLRAALEGVAFSVRDGLDALRQAGVQPARVRLAGGGTQRPFWRQLLADTLREPLHVSSVPNASARGAAFLAALATGTPLAALPAAPVGERLEPSQPDARLEWAYRRFRQAYRKLSA